jgi:hypothetical protein
MGIFCGSLACFSWLANPLFFIAVILLLRSRKAAALICLLAFLFAASFLLAHTIIKDEAGNYARITQYKAGYWIWLCSIGMLLVTTLIWSPWGAQVKHPCQ